MKVRMLPALALGAALVTAGCQNPDGSTDWGSTLALGAGLGLAAGAVAAVASDGGRHHGPRRVYGRGYDGRGHGRPYAQGYGRGWR